MDSAAGAVLGIQLGRYLMARGQQEGGTVGSAEFRGPAFGACDQPRDFHSGVLNEMMTSGNESAAIFPGTASAVRPAPLWQSLYRRARGESKSRWS